MFEMAGTAACALAQQHVGSTAPVLADASIAAPCVLALATRAVLVCSLDTRCARRFVLSDLRLQAAAYQQTCGTACKAQLNWVRCATQMPEVASLSVSSACICPPTDCSALHSTLSPHTICVQHWPQRDPQRVQHSSAGMPHATSAAGSRLSPGC